jgi:large subunit ribosomal protein L10
MALNLADKKAVVEEVALAASDAISAVVADYRGLTVTEMTKLRSQARQASVYLRVVRNTLAKRALAETEFSCLNEVLTGPMCLALSKEAPSDAARLLRDFAKDHENLEVKALTVGGTLYSSDQLDAVANLPTRNEALAKLLYVMKAPIEKFVRTLAEPHTKLVRTVAAIKDQKAG